MRINDFGITFSTVNGSGSATANNTIQRAIFKMGIPVCARNIFPSNIQGLPTWYALRVSQKGFLGRLEKDDILVCMNPETIQDDLAKLNLNGILLVNDNIETSKVPDGITSYRMPVSKILKDAQVQPNLSLYLANMVYVGVLAYLIGIDLEKIEIALDHHFASRRSAIDANLDIVKMAATWAHDAFQTPCDYRLEAIENANDMIMVDGNTAGALGALYGGLQYSAWYPITPATGLAESLNDYIPSLRTDPETGNISCVVVQAEDELAAIGMVVGAGWAGLRSMTSSSGPGLCLMSEYLGLAYFAEVPIVVWDVQRVGPSTGLPTHTSQGDLSFSYFISHGDIDMIILLPANVGECFEFGWKALDIAEELQTPVIVLSDLEMGMNIWMTNQFAYPETRMERGKILWEKDLDKILKSDAPDWGRYKDLDGDGIPYRTVPGNLHEKAAYFTRGTGHDESARYSEDAAEWEANLLRIQKKFEQAKSLLPKAMLHGNGKTGVGFISYGSSDMAMPEAVDILAAAGITSDYFRIRALPFTNEVRDYIQAHEEIYVVEANRDGQMCELLRMKYPMTAGRINSIARCNGLSLSAEWIVKQFLHARKEK